MIPTEQINSYIAEQDEWKRHFLVRIRQLIHQADERVEETWRWHGPHFDVNGIMIGIAAHRSFVTIWFHKGSLMKDPKGFFEEDAKSEKGMRSIKLREGDKLDEKGLMGLIKSAIALNDAGLKITDAKGPKKKLEIPEDLTMVLEKDKLAKDQWKGMTYSHKKEYVEWIVDAKKEETRKRRIAQAFQMIREGQGKEDKYRNN